MKSNLEEFRIWRHYCGKVSRCMTDKSFCSLLFLTLTVSPILLPQFVMAEDKGCAALRKDLELKRGQLAEYFVTLDKFRDKGERELESLLKDKINDLLDRIKKAEEVTDCGQREASATTEGMSPSKTDASEYVTKTCAGNSGLCLSSYCGKPNRSRDASTALFQSLPRPRRLLCKNRRENSRL